MERGVRQKKNSYWIWAVVIVAVLVAGAIWYFNRPETAENTNQNSNQVSAVNSANQNQTNGQANVNTSNINIQTNQNSAVTLQKYSDKEYHFSLSYPSTWKKSTSVTGSGTDKIFSMIITDPKHTDVSVSISVMDGSLEGQVKNSISITTEKSETINSQSAQRLTGGSAKDGSTVTIVLFKKNGTLYSLRGSGQEYESVVNSFEVQ